MKLAMETTIEVIQDTYTPVYKSTTEKFRRDILDYTWLDTTEKRRIENDLSDLVLLLYLAVRGNVNETR